MSRAFGLTLHACAQHVSASGFHSNQRVQYSKHHRCWAECVILQLILKSGLTQVLGLCKSQHPLKLRIQILYMITSLMFSEIPPKLSSLSPFPLHVRHTDFFTEPQNFPDQTHYFRYHRKDHMGLQLESDLMTSSVYSEDLTWRHHRFTERIRPDDIISY